MTAHSRWLIQDSSSTDQLLDQFKQKFTLEPMFIRHETLTFFDDFEWHLWRKNQLLASNNRDSILLVNTSELTFFENEPSPVFATNIDHPTLQEHLLTVTKGRRLFPMAELEVEFCNYAVRNKDLKKVCDLNIILTGFGTMIELKGLRGYDKEYRRSLKIIQRKKPDQLDHHIFHNSLNLLGIRPSDYRARPQYHLKPELDSGDATALVAQKLWHNVRINEEGIIRDWDAQFLQQYRVAIRRMRALFSQMKQSIGHEESNWFKTRLVQLAEPTSRMRDLDVYLKSEAEYTRLIPESFHEGLHQLFKDLSRERQQAHRVLAQHLKSPSYKSQISLLESRLALCPQAATKKGHKAIQQVAAQRIIKRYNSICLDAIGINNQTPDEQIHEIRLGCKKLRYLLEFFGELFPKKQTKPMLKALKRLQDNLGQFNDYSVQRESLDHYLSSHSVTPEIEAAVSALNGVLFNKQKEERAKVRDQLDDFLNQTIRSCAESLLTSHTARSNKAKKGSLTS
ncbi:CHAD domain-containing protein [Oceanospirillum maris]|uniref:CHAD domain-containing protein n=1 Tax=Oceanospirillum maris TaxID=64977 RepID=UPI0004111A61|nr:CHAD domain-containing protein [Oceanospirillum maris]